MTFLLKYREYIIIFFTYLLANIFLLLNTNGIYWDDWTLINSSHEAINSQFSQATGVFIGTIITSLHEGLLSVGNGIFIYRILTFALYFLVIVFVFSLLKQVKELSRRDRFWIVLLFAVAPLNSAKIALIDFPFGLFLSIFFLAFYVLSIYLKKKNQFLRFLILILFFISFVINSLLVYYALPLLYIFYIKYKDTSDTFLNKIKFFIMENIDFIVLPILFFVVKLNYFKATGLYASYNSLGFASILKAPVGILVSFYTSLVDPISQSFSLFYYFWIVPLFFIIFYKSKEAIEESEIENNNYMFLYLGIILYVLAVFPYAAVGKIPGLNGFDSRHQLLIPLGFTFIVYFIVKIISSKLQLKYYTREVILNFIIVAFVSQSIYSNYKYKLDWFYQVAMEEQMKESTLIRDHSTFSMDVKLHGMLANNRNISFYEHNGRLKKVFGEDSRLMLDKNKKLDSVVKYKKYKQYNFSSWRYETPIDLRVIKVAQPYSVYLKLLFYEFYDEEKFRLLAKNLIDVKEIAYVSK